MSWLTDIKYQNQNQNQNQVPVNNSVQKINKEDQGNWLQETQTEVTQKLNNLSVIDKALNWLGEAPDKTMVAIDNPESILWKGPEGINEAAKTLAWQAVTFEPSLALGASRMGYEKLRNLIVDEKKQRTPEEILAKVQESTELLPGLVDSPKTDVGKAIVKPVEEFFHKLLKGPRKISKDMSKFYGPNVGWLSEQVLTLGLLKFLHMEGQELQSGMGKIIETVKKKRKSSPKAKAKAEELSELLEDIKKSKEPSKYDKEFEKKVNEFEAIMQAEYKAEMENILKKQQETPNTLLPQEAQRPNKLPEAPDIKLPEPAQRILDFANKAKEQAELEKSKKTQEPQVSKQKENEKFETLDLKRIQKNNQRRIQNKIKKQQIEENLGLKEPEKIDKTIPESASDILARIPDLKTTGEAYAWGEKATESQIKDLEFAIKHSDQKIADLRAKKTLEALEDAFAEAQHKQLYRKAIERNQNIRSAKRKIEPKVKSESEPIKWRSQGKQFTDAVKSDLDVATDLGIYADIKEGLEAGKTRADIIQDIKKNEYLKEDMKDFEYQETDLPRAIRAVDIVEFKNPDAIKKLQKSLEKESKINEQIVKNKEVDNINRVDPEIGRKPGVEAPKQKKDSGTSDILDAYREHQKPIRFKTGEIARSRFMAEKTAQEQGLIGELVKDPNSEGWLVRVSKKQREAANKRLQSEWDKFLKEEPESTPAKESYWNERGEINLDIFIGPITETMKLLKRVARRLEKDKYIRNFNHNEKHLLEDLLYLHTDGKIDMDVTYGLGNIEKKIGISPKYKLDKYPQTEDTIKADITDRKSIPFKDKTIKSILYDPHYLVQSPRKKSRGKMVDRFGASPNVRHLWQMFDLATSNVYSLLKPGGKFIVKIQDATNRRTIQSVNEMYNFAVNAGFRPIDKFYYQPRTYMPLPKTAIGKQKVGRKIVTEYQVYEKPKRSYKHPDASVLSKNYKKPTVLEEGIPNSILKNERGELVIDLEGILKIREFIKSRKIPKIDAMDFLKNKGISQKDINKIFPKNPSVQKMNKVEPDKESQWLKPGQNPNEKLSARTLKNGRKAPAVTRKDARIIEQAPNINKPILGENTRIFTSEGIFTELGKPIREVFYRRVIKGEKKSSDIAKDLIRESNKIKKNLPLKGRYKSLQRIDNYGISLQPNGKARLLTQREKIVEKLTPKEMEVYKKLQILYKDLYNRINKVRKEVGLSPFPPVKNYTAWIHDMNKLKQMENISEFSTTDAIRKGLEKISKLPTKRDIKGRTLGLGGHEKFRRGPDSPGHLKLNAIDNFNKYALTASEFLGKAEPIAYLHELLQPKFELYKNANNTYNFLNEWLDYQKGKEPIMFISNPRTRRIMKKISGNVAVSFITYAPKSAVVQFSSFNNSIAELGFPRMVRGISRLVNSKEIQRAARESNVLSTRTPETILMDAITSDPMLPGKVGRLLHKGRKKIREVGTSPLNLTDSVVAYSTWLEGEAKGKKIFKKSAEYKNMDSAARKKALKEFSRNYADDMVVRAQGSAAKSARAPIQRTAEGGFVTTLQTFTIANFDYLARHVLGIKNPDITKTAQLGKVMNWVLASYLISQAFNSIGWKSPIPEPIKAYQENLEQTRNKEKAIKEAAKELLEFIPIIGGKVRYGSELSGVVTDQLVKLSEGDLTAIPRLMGIEGFSTLLKGYRAYKKDGTAADILMGRYVKKPKKNTRKGIGGL